MTMIGRPYRGQRLKCVNAHDMQDCLTVGRFYTVSEVVIYEYCIGVRLEEVDLPKGMRGFDITRFVTRTLADVERDTTAL